MKKAKVVKTEPKNSEGGDACGASHESEIDWCVYTDT